ncbi:hypothetical protein BX616_007451, partial [Lobosporangium transversale]
MPALPLVAAAVPVAMYVSAKLSLPQDAKMLKSAIGMQRAFATLEKQGKINLSYRFEESYRKYPNREALVFEGKSYSFRDVHL